MLKNAVEKPQSRAKTSTPAPDEGPAPRQTTPRGGGGGVRLPGQASEDALQPARRRKALTIIRRQENADRNPSEKLLETQRAAGMKAAPSVAGCAAVAVGAGIAETRLHSALKNLPAFLQ